MSISRRVLGRTGLQVSEIGIGCEHLRRVKREKIAKYQTGGMTIDAKIPVSVTPIRCLSYVLSQPAVCTTIAGVSNVDELQNILAYPKVSQEEKDYSRSLRELF